MISEPAAILTPAVLFLATIIRSAFGFGEALVAVPLLALLMPVEVAAPVAVLVSITVAFIVVVQDWRKIHVRSAVGLVFSTMLGIPLGLMLLKAVAEPVVKGILAAVIIAFSAQCIAQRRTPRAEERQVCMAFWIQRRSARRSLRYEWPSPGNLRFAPKMVSTACSGNFAGVFSSGKPRGPLGLPACRPLDSRGESILLTVIALGHIGDVSRSGNQPSPGLLTALCVMSTVALFSLGSFCCYRLRRVMPGIN